MNEKTLTFIPASEAAEMVGVSAQTIRNLCKAGTIRYQLRSQLFYACKEDVEQYMQSITEVHEAERTIDDYKKNLIKVSEQMHDTQKELQERVDATKNYPERVEQVYKALLDFIECSKDTYSNQEIELMKDLLQNDDVAAIAKKHSLTTSRIQAIWRTALWHTSHNILHNPRFENRTSEQEREIQALHDLLTAVESEEVSSTQPIEEWPISKCHFPIRTQKGLATAEIETVGDLLQLREIDLLNIPNFGKKSLCDVKAWLYDKGLSLSNVKH